MLQKLVWIGLGGALGTLARYGVSEASNLWVTRRFFGGDTAGLIWGTLVVNGLGCFLFGFTWSVFETKHSLSGDLRLGLLTGFLGAFTTFSTYAFESFQFTRTGHWMGLAGLMLAHNCLGLIMIWVGFSIGKA